MLGNLSEVTQRRRPGRCFPPLKLLPFPLPALSAVSSSPDPAASLAGAKKGHLSGEMKEEMLFH